jgi:hypothetical protein
VHNLALPGMLMVSQEHCTVTPHVAPAALAGSTVQCRAIACCQWLLLVGIEMLQLKRYSVLSWFYEFRMQASQQCSQLSNVDRWSPQPTPQHIPYLPQLCIKQCCSDVLCRLYLYTGCCKSCKQCKSWSCCRVVVSDILYLLIIAPL